MALDIGNEKVVSGHYLYISNKKIIQLKGIKVDEKTIELFEYVNNELTGRFLLKYDKKLESKFSIKVFTWYAPDGSKELKVEVDDVDTY